MSLLVLLSILAFAVITEGMDLAYSSILLSEFKSYISTDEYYKYKEALTLSRSVLVKPQDDLPYDKNTDTYYTSHHDVRLWVCDGSKLTIHIDPELKLYSILAFKDAEYSEMKMVVTGTPILNVKTIKTGGKKPAIQSMNKELLTVYSPDSSDAPEEYAIQRSIRGGSSQNYEKKSYRIKGYKTLLSLCGLPLNEKYALNSLYEDEYKIRDILSWGLWAEGSARSNKRGLYNSADMVLVELIIDGSYEGMYGLQPYVNEYTLQLTKTKGTILKVKSWEYPDLLYYNEDSQQWNGVYVKYSNMEQNSKWMNFYEFVANLTNLSDMTEFFKTHLDIESFLDYCLFIDFIGAVDNTWKNVFFTITNTDGVSKIMITPWDLDLTFGAIWTDWEPYYTTTDYENIAPTYNTSDNGGLLQYYSLNLFMNECDIFLREATKRYFELRQTHWSESNILAKIAKYQDYIKETGMYARDLARWPGSPVIAEGKEDFISEYMKKRIGILDDWYRQVLEME